MAEEIREDRAANFTRLPVAATLHLLLLAALPCTFRALHVEIINIMCYMRLGTIDI